MESKYLKHLFERINTLSKMEHDEIFKIIKDKTSYSKNKNGVFFNLSNLDQLVVDEIDKFVNYCINNKQDLDDYDKKMNECKMNHNFTNMMGENDELTIKPIVCPIEDWNVIVTENKSMQKIATFIEKILSDKEKIGKKKINVKFNAAKKRFAKKINQQNLILEDMEELIIEPYII